MRAEVQAEVERMRLPELRKMRNLSQTTIAKLLEISQGDVSKLERRTDMYLSTLRSYIEAAGGKLQIVAQFPNSVPIEIDTFDELDYGPIMSEAIGSPTKTVLQPGANADHA
ncbi:MAG: helix-turn-helix domain-containing protein [Candidatus Eremiobacteraeota bacterium]|nr:helix-turn-helix domain-containing protein [Candidatus Eremiobacteraeota bacterium]